MEIIDNINKEQLYTAYLHYQQHKKAAKKYYETHKEKHNEDSKKWFAKMKSDPEKYKAYVEKRREQMRQRRAAEKEKKNENQNIPKSI